MADRGVIRGSRCEPPRERRLGVVGDLPRQTVDAEFGGQTPGTVHLFRAVVPLEQDVPPVDERQVAVRAPLLVRHRPHGVQRKVEPPALPVARVAFGKGAVDREGDLVDAGVDQPPGPRFGQRQSVGARVEIDLREALLDVLAHLDGPLVQERLAVVEEVDASEARTGLVDDPGEQIEIEHPRLPRARDAGLGRAAGLEAGDVAGRRAFDVEPGRQGAGIDRPHRRRVVFTQRQLERAVAAEAGASRVQIGAQVPDGFGVPDFLDGLLARVPQHAPCVRVGAAADDPAVAGQHERAPGPGAAEPVGEMIERHRSAASRSLAAVAKAPLPSSGAASRPDGVAPRSDMPDTPSSRLATKVPRRSRRPRGLPPRTAGSSLEVASGVCGERAYGQPLRGSRGVSSDGLVRVCAAPAPGGRSWQPPRGSRRVIRPRARVHWRRPPADVLEGGHP